MPKKLGRYEIVRPLGKGAMGIVYEGFDPTIKRRVAIKTARRELMSDTEHAEELLARFVREAQAAGALNHPNLVTVLDVGEEEGTFFIAMEFLEGEDLGKVLKRTKKIEPAQAIEICATVCDALDHAHEKGIVHRDIKPSNVVMLNDGRVKITDFGIAYLSDTTLTRDGTLIGTPYYMSPEQFTGQKVDGRADLFSVGVMLYEMITGEKPFQGEALTTVMHHVLESEPIPPHKLNMFLEECTTQVVMKALCKKPSQRYSRGRAMAKALRECLEPNPDPEVLQFGECEGGETAIISSKAVADANVTTHTGVKTPVEADSGAKTQVPKVGTILEGASAELDAGDILDEKKSAGKKKTAVFWGVGALAAMLAALLYVFLAPGGAGPGPDEPSWGKVQVITNYPGMSLDEQPQAKITVSDDEDQILTGKWGGQAAPAKLENIETVGGGVTFELVPRVTGNIIVYATPLTGGYEPEKLQTFSSPDKPGQMYEAAFDFRSIQ